MAVCRANWRVPVYWLLVPGGNCGGGLRCGGYGKLLVGCGHRSVDARTRDGQHEEEEVVARADAGVEPGEKGESERQVYVCGLYVVDVMPITHT